MTVPLSQRPGKRRFRAGVLGGSGFAGAELVRRLLFHPEVEVVRVCAADHVGEPIAHALPHLEGLTDLVFENPPPDAAVAGLDVVLMGLPHGASIDVVERVADTDVRVIDMSGAFRLKDLGAYARFYGGPHARPALLERFVYGLPELERERIRSARYVSSPGCFATAIELALLPFARAGLLQGSVEVVGVTGSSGSGVTPSVTTHHPTRSVNLRTYRPLSHQHAPEIEAALTSAGARNLSLNFVPVSAPLPRGIFATAFFRVPAGTSTEALDRLPHDTYAQEPFVRVPQNRLPEVAAISGSNYAEVGVVVGPEEDGTRLVTAFAALDNLVKGGAGQAIQNMNLMFGLPETTALRDPGGYP
jgi:LysW-gamma-L-alpha-aminoadipyl-6-phosphate/LysW-L-glutamyl-5-phosphate reductase